MLKTNGDNDLSTSVNKLQNIENESPNSSSANCTARTEDFEKNNKISEYETDEDPKKENAEHNNNKISNEKTTSIVPDTEKCDICGQFLNNSDIIYYQGHPQDAVEEYIALTNEKLVLASGKTRYLLLSKFL